MSPNIALIKYVKIFKWVIKVYNVCLFLVKTSSAGGWKCILSTRRRYFWQISHQWHSELRNKHSCVDSV